MNEIVVFDEIKAEMAIAKKENSTLIFDYEDKQGNAEARSHVFKLRKFKGKVAALHKTTKAEALAACRAIDAQKNTLFEDIVEMVAVHQAPLDAVEKRKQEKIEAVAKAFVKEKERIEQERLDAIEAREAEMACKEAEMHEREEIAQRAEEERLASIKAKEDKIKADREKLEAEKRAEAEAKRREQVAKEQAEIDRQAALEKAEQEKQEAIEAEREKAGKEAKAKEDIRLAQEAAERRRKQQTDEEEKRRIENQKHRKKVEDNIHFQLNQVIADESLADEVVEAIKAGRIENLAISY